MKARSRSMRRMRVRPRSMYLMSRSVRPKWMWRGSKLGLSWC